MQYAVLLGRATVKSNDSLGYRLGLGDRDYAKWQNQLQGFLTSSKKPRGRMRYRSIGFNCIVYTLHNESFLFINTIIDYCPGCLRYVVVHTVVYQGTK